MSKQAEAKARQGYVQKAVPHVCSNCEHFAGEVITTPTLFGMTRKKDVNMRCALGGFSVKKMGTCNEWSGKDSQ